MYILEKEKDLEIKDLKARLDKMQSLNDDC